MARDNDRIRGMRREGEVGELGRRRGSTARRMFNSQNGGGGTASLLRRNPQRTASDLGGRIDDGGAPTVFTSATNPELEQDPSRGGRAPGRSLRQDLSATRGRTEVGPATDPGGGAGRVRPVAPTLSRRELEEQRRRASHDASSARASLRQSVGPIGARGPTRSQQAALSSAPTAGDFLNQRVAAITAASQPNAAESEAQERGLRRLDSDRGFALDSRGQQIDMRGQDTEERLGLRREETLRRGQDISSRDKQQGDRISVGDRITSSLWQNEAARTALIERYGTENRGEIAEIISNNVMNMAERTNWENLPPEFQTEQGQQQLMDLVVVGHVLADSENTGILGKIFGTQKQGLPQDFNTITENIRDLVASGETARLFRPSQSEAAGRTFDIGGIPPEQQRLLRQMMSSARQSILNDDSEQGRRLQLQMAENELQQERDRVRSELKSAGTDRLRSSVSLTGMGGERAREAQREAQQELDRLEGMDPAGYLAQLKREEGLQDPQAQIDEELGR